MNISAIIMASGFSKRMGMNKLNLPLNGKKLYEYTLDLVSEIDFYEKIVVSNNDEILNYAKDKNIKRANNEQAEVGKSESIKIALNSLSKADGYMFFVCDQPYVSKKTVLELISEFEKNSDKIIYPVYGIKRGAPMIFPYSLKEDLLELEKDQGGVKLITDENSRSILIGRRREHIDIDTIEDYEKEIKFINKPLIVVRGAGDIATGSIQKLHRSGFKVLALETNSPTAIRRTVCLSEAVFNGDSKVEDISARLIDNIWDLEDVFREELVAIMVDKDGDVIEKLKPEVVVDAILAKKNLGTNKKMAKGTVALGPGFVAGEDVDIVVETNRGHNLGRLIFNGSAEPNTGNPGNIEGFTTERVLYSPANGKIENKKEIGDIVKKDEVISIVNGKELKSKIDGVVRGLIRNGSEVFDGMKVGDVDPREDTDYNAISDKARSVGGATLEAVMILLNETNKYY